MTKGNNHRDNVEAAMREYFEQWLEGGKNIDAGVVDLADAVFDTLGITEDEQDSTGGYFMHHAGKKSKEYILIPLTDEIKNALSWEEAGHYIWKQIQEARDDGQ